MSKTIYPLDILDFKVKAKDTIKLFENMCETFGQAEVKLTQFQREYLSISIMAACLDSHHNGFKNGISK